MIKSCFKLVVGAVASFLWQLPSYCFMWFLLCCRQETRNPEIVSLSDCSKSRNHLCLNPPCVAQEKTRATTLAHTHAVSKQSYFPWLLTVTTAEKQREVMLWEDWLMRGEATVWLTLKQFLCFFASLLWDSNEWMVWGFLYRRLCLVY